MPVLPPRTGVKQPPQNTAQRGTPTARMMTRPAVASQTVARPVVDGSSQALVPMERPLLTGSVTTGVACRSLQAAVVEQGLPALLDQGPYPLAELGLRVALKEDASKLALNFSNTSIAGRILRLAPLALFFAIPSPGGVVALVLTLAAVMLQRSGRQNQTRESENKALTAANQIWIDLFQTPEARAKLGGGSDDKYRSAPLGTEVAAFRSMKSGDGRDFEFRQHMMRLKPEDLEYRIGARELARIVYEGCAKDADDPYFRFFLRLTRDEMRRQSPLALPLLTLLGLDRVVGRSWSMVFRSSMLGGASEIEFVLEIIQEVEKQNNLLCQKAVDRLREVYSLNEFRQRQATRALI